MKIVFTLISALIVIAVIAMAALNSQATLNLVFLGLKGQHVLANVKLVEVILFVFIAGVVTGILWASSFYVASQSKLKEYKRKLEQNSALNDADNSLLDVLDAKILTLESALKEALAKINEYENNNNSSEQ